MDLTNWWQGATQWFGRSSQKSLEQAFRSALKIKEIEDQYFQGKKIGPENCDYSADTVTYFANQIQRHLRKIEQEIYHLNSDQEFVKILSLDPADRKSVV